MAAEEPAPLAAVACSVMAFDGFNAPGRLWPRRAALAGLACLGSLLVAPAWARRTRERGIALLLEETGEAFDGVYWSEGSYDRAALARINWLMRDFHCDAVAPIDPALVDMLHALQFAFGGRRPVTILSGFRTTETNAELRRQGMPAVTDSEHLSARAADICIAGVSAARLHRAAAQLCWGGVGFYRHFVHVDTGPHRRWYAPTAACEAEEHAAHDRHLGRGCA